MKTIKNRTEHMIHRLKDEKAAIFVESAIVFPVMFFVLFFIMYIGNLYYVQARVDSLVLNYAVKGAEYVADPYQVNIDDGKPVPTDLAKMDIQPYRYILGSLSDGAITDIEDKLSKELKEELNKGNMFLFANQKINHINTDNKRKLCEWHNYIMYSSFVVQVNYDIKFPIRFIFEEKPTIAKMSSRAEVSVNDTAEFIRNLDMTADLIDEHLGQTGAVQRIKNIFKKINDFISKF